MTNNFDTNSPGLSRPLALVALIAIAAAGYFGWQHFNQTDEFVFLIGGHQFSKSEMAAAETAFAKSGLNDFKLIDNQIQVALKDRADYTKALDEAKAIPESVKGYTTAPIHANPFMTSHQQRQMAKAQKQEKIRAMLCQIDGIEQVIVEFDESRPDRFSNTVERTAAISAKAPNQEELKQHQIDTIRKAVQSAVAGLGLENILVIDGNSGIAYDHQSLVSSPVEQNDLTRGNDDYEPNPNWDTSILAAPDYELLKSEIQRRLPLYPNAIVKVKIGSLAADPEIFVATHRLEIPINPAALPQPKFAPIPKIQAESASRKSSLPSTRPTNILRPETNQPARIEPAQTTTVTSTETTADSPAETGAITDLKLPESFDLMAMRPERQKKAQTTQMATVSIFIPLSSLENQTSNDPENLRAGQAEKIEAVERDIRARVLPVVRSFEASFGLPTDLDITFEEDVQSTKLTINADGETTSAEPLSSQFFSQNASLISIALFLIAAFLVAHALFTKPTSKNEIALSGNIQQESAR